MPLQQTKGRKSIVPCGLNRNLRPRPRFRLLSKVESAQDRANAPVYLNVYDITRWNRFLYWAGLGIFHSGVQVHGIEYAFGAHDYPVGGIFRVEPLQCPGFKLRRSILIGTTCMDPVQVREFINRQLASYHGNTYHFIVKNCNHFSKDVCYKLTGKKIPKWVNRLAKLGSTCNCILPEVQDPNFQEKQSEIRSSSGSRSDVSIRGGSSNFGMVVLDLKSQSGVDPTLNVMRQPHQLSSSEGIETIQ